MDDMLSTLPCPDDFAMVEPSISILDADSCSIVFYASCIVCKKNGRHPIVMGMATLDIGVYFQSKRDGMPWAKIRKLRC